MGLRQLSQSQPMGARKLYQTSNLDLVSRVSMFWKRSKEWLGKQGMARPAKKPSKLNQREAFQTVSASVSTIKPATLDSPEFALLDNPAIALPALSWPSRRRFLIGSCGIAATGLPAAIMVANAEHANASTPSNPSHQGTRFKLLGNLLLALAILILSALILIALLGIFVVWLAVLGAVAAALVTSDLLAAKENAP
jgi:hypothetical protein